MEESILVLAKSRPTLQALSQLAPKLNAATDLYMNELKEIEAALDKLKLGIAVENNRWLHTGNTRTEWDEGGEPTGDFFAAWSLGYGKDHRGKWCLLVREYKVNAETEEDVERDVSPLLESSRDLRIAAAEQIPDLLKAIEQEVKKKIEILGKVSDKR